MQKHPIPFKMNSEPAVLNLYLAERGSRQIQLQNSMRTKKKKQFNFVHNLIFGRDHLFAHLLLLFGTADLKYSLIFLRYLINFIIIQLLIVGNRAEIPSCP